MEGSLISKKTFYTQNSRACTTFDSSEHTLVYCNSMWGRKIGLGGLFHNEVKLFLNKFSTLAIITRDLYTFYHKRVFKELFFIKF